MTLYRHCGILGWLGQKEATDADILNHRALDDVKSVVDNLYIAAFYRKLNTREKCEEMNGVWKPENTEMKCEMNTNIISSEKMEETWCKLKNNSDAAWHRSCQKYI